ncbi:MAG TPA: hypothetical protein DEB31_08890, partial [Clostridiales bacterium]|nr:hypothetical protein [Clostridiales bacterium]
AAALERFTAGPGHMTEADGDKGPQLAATVFMDGLFHSRLASGIEILDEREIIGCVQEINQKALKHKGATGKLLFDLYSEILDIFLHSLKSQGFSPELYISAAREDLHACGTAQEAFSYIAAEISAAMRRISEEKKQKDRKPINAAKQYIQSYFDSPLCLDEVSEIVGFNPTYFSHVFKKETGKSFTEYLTEVRVKNAKQLLIGTDDNVFDIAERVGYGDYKYFSKLFKKIAGLNPSDFRKLHR